MQTGVGPVPLAVPRDRAGTFEPLLIPKRSGRVAGGLDDMIIALYAHGMSVRDILHHLEQVYGTQLSAETVSRITDQVLEEVRAWQSRPLDPVYAVVFLDAIMVKVRDNQVVQNSPPTWRSASTPTGRSTCWASGWPRPPPETATAGEGARFWNSVMTDLRNRGVRDILIACCDGLAGFEDAITAAFPAHRDTALRRPSHQERAAPWPAATRARSPKSCGRSTPRRPPRPPSTPWPASPPRRGARKNPQAGRVFEEAWDAFTPFLAFSPAVRKLLYTTNAIESLNYQLRKVTKARGHFPTDDAVVKLLWLAIINIEDKRARERAARRAQTGKRSDQPARLVEGQRVMGWREALNELGTAYPGRLR